MLIQKKVLSLTHQTNKKNKQYEKDIRNTIRNGSTIQLLICTTCVYYAFRTFFRTKIMKFKITNKKTGSSEVMNHEQICDRIMICKGKFFDKYSKEHFSDTPIQDELNVRQFCWLDIMFTVCATSVVLLLIYQYAI